MHNSRACRVARGRIRPAFVALVVVIAAACSPSEARSPLDLHGAPPPSGSGGEPTVWSAVNQPHNELITLQCRGGAGFEFKSLGSKSTPQGGVRVAIAMTFAASERAAGSRNENLAPATCAPSDRVLTASEPREVHFLSAAFSQPFIGPIDVSARAAEYHPDVRSIAAYLRDPGHYWTFNASDTHRGYFDASTHQYWKNFSAQAAVAPPAQNTATEIARWLVRIRIEGGFAGTKREVSVNGDGRLQASSTWVSVRCSAELPPTQIQSLEAALARSRPDTWAPAYVRANNPNGCCDQYTTSVHIEQEDAQGRRTNRSTYWFNDSAGTVPEGVIALFKSVYETGMACSRLGS